MRPSGTARAARSTAALLSLVLTQRCLFSPGFCMPLEDEVESASTSFCTAVCFSACVQRVGEGNRPRAGKTSSV